jgi:hypothetical protein
MDFKVDFTVFTFQRNSKLKATQIKIEKEACNVGESLLLSIFLKIDNRRGE